MSNISEKLDPDKLTEDQKEAWRRLCETKAGRTQVIEHFTSEGAFEMRMKGHHGYGLRPGVVLAQKNTLRRLFEVIGEVDGLRELAELFQAEGTYNAAAEVMQSTAAPLVPRDYLRIGEEHLERKEYAASVAAFKLGPNPNAHFVVFRARVLEHLEQGVCSADGLIGALKLIGETLSSEQIIYFGRQALSRRHLETAKSFLNTGYSYKWPPDVCREFADALVHHHGAINTIGKPEILHELLRLYFAAPCENLVQEVIDRFIQIGLWQSAANFLTERGITLDKKWYIHAAKQIQYPIGKLDCLKNGNCVDEIVELVDKTLATINTLPLHERWMILSNVESGCRFANYTNGLLEVAHVRRAVGDFIKANTLYEELNHVPNKEFYEGLAAQYMKNQDGKGVLKAAAAMERYVALEREELERLEPAPFVKELVLRVEQK